MNDAIAPENKFQPEHWSEALLGDIAKGIKAGKSFRCIERPPTTGEKGIVKISAVTWGRFQDEESKTVTEPERLDPSSLIQENDLLISRANTIELVGASVLATKTKKELYLSDKVLRIEIEDNLKKWVHYFLSSPTARTYISESSTGNQLSMRNISQKALLALKIPFPPLNEQRRIADKLDITLADIEACKQKLNNAAETIQRFRQSVLAAAVSGELTREWREERGITTEWEIQPIENVADARLGKMLDKSKNTGPERKYIGNINVRWFEFDLSNLATIRVSDEEFQKLSLQPGDLLVCEGGEPGRCAVWEKETTPITYQKALHRIRPKPNIDSHFLSFCFKNAAEDGSLQKLFTGSTIKHLTGKSLSKFLVPVPSKQEQELVISKTLALLEVASTIESKILQTQSVLTRLTSAILSKAFRGELVPQDPNDEPASVLLERIKAQREAEAEAKKPAKRDRKKKADTALEVKP
ncbi:restriction endonuclease subunit S [Synechococcus sp. MIT S9452]|uniref:restriction endonuclease subunit S n=1 Tax=Synechococcus sp. MIT S9452 TaxID=3082546 RepID=UPI0039A743EC